MINSIISGGIIMIIFIIVFIFIMCNRRNKFYNDYISRKGYRKKSYKYTGRF